ncbi:hypothetical protein GCM10010430_18870 [Kitasatospora cystarginea]|uniref:DUF5753 domain-containing protein n=1 Tax=Kitasatospora cystarginea TaxID=58350 RepID=A0ABP5QJZ9_9ACTN
MSELESETGRLREYRAEAEAAANALETAWKVAGLPSDINVMPIVSGRGMYEGPHVSFGGGHARVAWALAEALTDYARLSGRLIDGEPQSLVARMLADLRVAPALPDDGLYVVRRELSA